ncbi:MAG: 2-iminoacetate synthase ThiH [Desulfobacterales bacterium]|nr:2-iminoacetate synthase ThiH [Desulfobacterales bacterium]
MFTLPDFQRLRDIISACTAPEVERALAGPHPGISTLAALLSPAAAPYLPQMAVAAAGITAMRFGRTTQIYAPIYIHNFCHNHCLYCGFSADNRIERCLLTIDQAAAEAEILHQRGFNHILLVSGEAPGKMGVEYLEELAQRLRQRFAAISIEVQPLATDEYVRLFRAGITGVAVYQETYDRAVYGAMHPAGRKRDFDFRLETPARVARAGMREVGIGALLGLSDWRAEGLALGLHLAWLRKNFWRTALTVSFPRLRPAAGGFEPLTLVSERDLSQLIFALRIFDPDAGIVLSTREEARFRDGMVGLGPTRYSAGSCTAPGGYSHPHTEGEQFSIGDQRTIDQVCSAIRRKGYDPVRKDWDPSFQLAD